MSGDKYISKENSGDQPRNPQNTGTEQYSQPLEKRFWSTRHNRELLNEYFNQLLHYLRAIVRHRLLLIALKDHAGRIAGYFNHNYHLE